jgi:hypothetical protein
MLIEIITIFFSALDVCRALEKKFCGCGHLYTKLNVEYIIQKTLTMTTVNLKSYLIINPAKNNVYERMRL